ncbi:MAG: hypothetical protein WA227_08605 [Mycobacterium sp.]|uniref:hypothetical protein n=1 Tax=Mycobacterium sp. TaxID=1785 RepID=UPI003BB54637
MRSIGYVATVTALEDDEPNRSIRVTAHIHKTDETKTFEVKPGDTFDRLAHANDLRQTVMVLAPEFWKWIGTHFNDPKTGQRVQIIEVVRAPHPDDGREILAMVVSDGQKRHPIYWEQSGKMVVEGN